MNERLTLQDLIDLLAGQQELTKKDAENFLRELVSLISDTIEKNDTVKIKDFGTFKLVKVNARKSVDVNTGVDIEIPAHYKLSFTPDKVIKDTLNRPFAHFETVLLEDGVTFDSIEKPVRIQLSDDEDEDLDEDIEEVKPELAKQIPGSDIAPKTVVVEETIVSPAANKNKVEEKHPVASQEIEQTAQVNIPKPEAAVVLEEQSVKVTDNVEEKKEAYSKPIHQSAAEVEEKRNIARKTSYVDEYDDDDDNAVDYGTPRRNYYVIGMIAAAIIGVIFLLVRFFPDIQAAFFEKDQTFANMEGNSPVTNPEMSGDSIVIDPLGEAQSLVSNESGTKDEALGKTEESAKPRVSGKNEYIAEITLERGQTLRQLALDYYKNRVFWVYIFEANRELVKNPNSINAGMKLKIPALKNFGIDPNNPDDLKIAKKQESDLFREFP